jgi:hypothetical protein
MKKLRKLFLFSVCLLTFCFLFVACENGSKAASPEESKQKAKPTASSDKSCAAMNADVSAITGRKLRPRPLDIEAPQEGLLRGCTWSEEGGALHTFQLTKQPASKYKEEHDPDKFKISFPEKFKQLEGFGGQGFVSPTIEEGYIACSVRGSECFCAEANGEGTTADQATKLLRLAMDRF